METISAREIIEIIKTLSKSTILNYLDNYRFTKFRVTHYSKINDRFYLTREFLTALYSFFWYRNKIKEATTVKNYFKEFDLEVMPYEEYVK